MQLREHVLRLRHIPCFCGWCTAQLQKETVEEKYDKPGSGCVLWPIMEILDDKKIPTGKGYNDWRFGEFVEKTRE